tara:strand:- start:1356 stop:1787 length:432 start_codon:yes stop_codon:yes gene_type:complete
MIKNKNKNKNKNKKKIFKGGNYNWIIEHPIYILMIIFGFLLGIYVIWQISILSEAQRAEQLKKQYEKYSVTGKPGGYVRSPTVEMGPPLSFKERYAQPSTNLEFPSLYPNDLDPANITRINPPRSNVLFPWSPPPRYDASATP